MGLVQCFLMIWGGALTFGFRKLRRRDRWMDGGVLGGLDVDVRVLEARVFLCPVYTEDHMSFD